MACGLSQLTADKMIRIIKSEALNSRRSSGLAYLRGCIYFLYFAGLWGATGGAGFTGRGGLVSSAGSCGLTGLGPTALAAILYAAFAAEYAAVYKPRAPRSFALQWLHWQWRLGS
jgi:hypothetical protein